MLLPTRAPFGLVFCLSVHVGDHILTPALTKWSALELSKNIPADL